MKMETTNDLKFMDPVTGKIIYSIGKRIIICIHNKYASIRNDGRVVYRDPNGGWIYEAPGYAILSRNYPAMAPVIEES